MSEFDFIDRGIQKDTRKAYQKKTKNVFIVIKIEKTENYFCAPNEPVGDGSVYNSKLVQ